MIRLYGIYREARRFLNSCNQCFQGIAQAVPIRLLLSAVLWTILAAGFPQVAMSAHNPESAPVLEAAKGVYRVMALVPLPEELAALKDAPPEIMRAARERGLPVYDFQGKRYLMAGHGSAYLVSSQGHWVTNHHVIENADYTYCLLSALSPNPVLLPVRILWKDKNKDLAVIQATPPAGVRPLSFADSGYILSALPVFSIGFQANADEISGGLRDQTAYITPKIHGGILSNPFVQQGGATRMWQHDAAISGGNSGGPLVNACGQVVGTNSMGHKESQSVLGAIDLRELLPELTRLNVGFTQLSGMCESAAQAMPKWIYGVLGLVAVLAVGLVAFLLYLRGLLLQGRALPAAVSGPVSQVVLKSVLGKKALSAPGAAEGGPQWKTDVNGRQMLFDPVWGVVFKGNEPAGWAAANGVVQPPAGRPAADKAVPPPAGLVLRSARFGDIALHDGQTLVVGSDKETAQFVIRERFISRTHVRLSNRGGQLWAEDLGSTNGTFLNGSRLTAPAAIRPGDVLSLTENPGLAEFRPVTGADGRREQVWSGALLPQFLGVRAVPVGPGSPVSIGRAPDNSISVPNKLISSRHCLVSMKSDGSFELRDSGSLNGTFLPGKPGRVETAVLQAGQSFYLVKPIYSFKLIDR